MNRNLWATLVFACALLAAAPAAWAAPPSAAPSPEILTERLDSLRDTVKDLAADAKANTQAATELKTTLQAQDKRIDDFNARIDNALSILGILLAATLALTYWGADRRAKKEAETWIEKNQAKLRKKISELERNVDEAKKHVADTTSDFDDYTAKRRAAVDAAEKSVTEGEAISMQDAEALRSAETGLRNKPESQYTAEDWKTRGLAAFSEKKHDAAVYYFGRIVELPTATDEQVAGALLNKGIALRRQGKPDEAIAAYDEAIRRFGDDPAPALRERVAKALLNKGVALGHLGKSDDAIAAYDEVIRRFGDDDSAEIRDTVERARKLREKIPNRQKGGGDAPQDKE